MNYWLFIIPVIAAFIGWITNRIAIKMLFHPREPIYFLGLTIQGIFPKRQKLFAAKLGKLVSEQLLSYEDIQQKISDPKNLEKILPMIEGHIENFLRVKLSDEMPFLSMFIGDKTIHSLKTIFLQELQIIFPQVMINYTQSLKTDLDLEQIVTDKVAAFSTDKLESILYQVMANEFRFVEVIGAVIGFLIGLVQVMISLFIK